MRILDYSDSLVKVGPSVLQKVNYTNSDELIRFLTPYIRNEKVTVVIPESDILINRIHLISPSSNRSEIIRLIRDNSPHTNEEIIFSHTYLTKTQEVITYAMKKTVYNTYITLLSNCKAFPECFIPQAALVYEALKDNISISDIVLFIDIGSISSECIVLDSYGPLCAFEEDLHEKNITHDLPKIITKILNECGKKVSKIILSGDGAYSLHDKLEILELPVTFSMDYITIPRGVRKDALAFFNILALNKSYGALQQVDLLQDQEGNDGSFIQRNSIGIFGGIILLCTVLFIINKEIQLRNASVTSPIVQITPSQIPTPSPKKITLADISFEVLNGSGIEGQAQKVADLLKTKNITKVTTANAETYSYVKTVIRVKKAFQSMTDEIETLLKSQFELDKTEVLNSTASADIQIIVGK